MATITIRDLPAEVHARLKEQARLHRRSLNQEVVMLLASDVLPEGKRAHTEEVLRRIAALRKKSEWKMSQNLKFDPVNIVRKARDSR